MKNDIKVTVESGERVEEMAGGNGIFTKKKEIRKEEGKSWRLSKQQLKLKESESESEPESHSKSESWQFAYELYEYVEL